MASDLKWKTGFDWGSVLIMSLSIAGVFCTSSVLRWIFVLLFLLSGSYMYYQYKKWNTPGWRQIHFRAMLLYATIAGHEQSKSLKEQRLFDMIDACRQLGLSLCGPGKEINVETMVIELSIEKGNYLAGLLAKHQSEILPSASKGNTESLHNLLMKVDFGPTLIIANVIENTFGSMEAARYAFALITRDAH